MIENITEKEKINVRNVLVNWRINTVDELKNISIFKLFFSFIVFS